jgi:hypothetical protein
MHPLRRANGRMRGFINTYFVGAGFDSNFRYKYLRECFHLFAYDSFNDALNRLRHRMEGYSVSTELRRMCKIAVVA